MIGTYPSVLLEQVMTWCPNLAFLSVTFCLASEGIFMFPNSDTDLSLEMGTVK